MLLWLTACDRQTVFHQYEPLLGEWEQKDTLHFGVPPMKEAGTYHAVFGIRIGQTFPFQTMNVTVRQTILPSGKVNEKTFDCELIGKDGYATGDGVSYYQNHFDIDDLALQAGDSLSISIWHNMRREVLAGVNDVGYKLSRQ